jgi:hypothetical protein
MKFFNPESIEDAYQEGFWAGVDFRAEYPDRIEYQAQHDRNTAKNSNVNRAARAFSLGAARGIRSDVRRPCECCGRDD